MKNVIEANYTVISERAFYEQTLQPTSLAVPGKRFRNRNELGFSRFGANAVGMPIENRNGVGLAKRSIPIKKILVFGVKAFIVAQIASYAFLSLAVIKNFGIAEYLNVILH